MATSGCTTTKESSFGQAAQDPEPFCGMCFSGSTDCKMLPCQHVFCETCLQKLLLAQEDGSYVLGCPTCQFPVVLPSDGTVGLPTIEPINEVHVDQNKIPACSKHNMSLQVYCETCEAVLCNMCAIESHREHQHNIITSDITKHHKEIRSILEEVKIKAKGIEEVVADIDTRKDEIQKQSTGIKQEIHSLADRLVDLIRTSETKLSASLDNITQQKLSTLSLQKDEGTVLAHKINDFSTFIESNLTSSIPHEFLSKKKEMKEMAEQLRSLAKSTTTSQPLEKADLKFSGNGSLLVLNKNLGSIQHSFIHQYCKPMKPKVSALRARSINTLEFNMLDYDDTPIPIPLSFFKCQLSNDINNDSMDCTVEETAPGVYSFGFTPTTEGVHKLSVLISGQPIPNSPFSIAIASSLAIKGQTLKVIPDLQNPWGVAITAERMIVVAETGSHCVCVFKENGKKVKIIGSKGKDDGQFTDPRGVAITSNGHILVTDYNRIQKLTISGQCVRSICGKGSGALQFSDPKGISVHPVNGKIFIADSNNHRIQVLNSDFSFSHSFGGPPSEEFQYPWDVICDDSDHVYIVDNAHHTVYKYTSDGQFLLKFGSKGFEPGQLNWPSGIGFGADRNLYVTDDNNAVSVFDTNGKFIKRIGLEEDDTKNVSFKHPLGITADNTGKLYISDCWNNRLIVL